MSNEFTDLFGQNGENGERGTEGNNLDINYMDFAKDFDKKPHQRLITKLREIGINGYLLKRIIL